METLLLLLLFRKGEIFRDFHFTISATLIAHVWSRPLCPVTLRHARTAKAGRKHEAGKEKYEVGIRLNTRFRDARFRRLRRNGAKTGRSKECYVPPMRNQPLRTWVRRDNPGTTATRNSSFLKFQLFWLPHDKISRYVKTLRYICSLLLRRFSRKWKRLKRNL